jgi:hypothetical protein
MTIADQLYEAERELAHRQKAVKTQAEKVIRIYNRLLKSPWKQRFRSKHGKV